MVQSSSPLLVEVLAVSEQLVSIRHRLSQWLALRGSPPHLTADILLVVNEACSNSIEHGYAGRRPGVVRVSAEANTDTICITVEDFGRWRNHAADTGITRGRGLPLMQAMSTQLELRTNIFGTRVSMTFPSPSLTRSADDDGATAAHLAENVVPDDSPPRRVSRAATAPRSARHADDEGPHGID